MHRDAAVGRECRFQLDRYVCEQRRVWGLHKTACAYWQVVNARPFVPQCPVDQDHVGRGAQVRDAARRGDAEEATAPRCELLRGNQHGERGAHGAADDPGHRAVRQRKLAQFGVVAGPALAAPRAAAEQETCQIAVQVQHAEFGHIPIGQAALAPRFPQQVLRTEHRLRSVVFGNQEHGGCRSEDGAHYDRVNRRESRSLSATSSQDGRCDIMQSSIMLQTCKFRTMTVATTRTTRRATMATRLEAILASWLSSVPGPFAWRNSTQRSAGRAL